MARTSSKQGQGRSARAADLITALAETLPPTHPGRPLIRELQEIFGPHPCDERTRALLELVPGNSVRAKARAIGINYGAVWSIWHGKYKPSPEVLAKIEAAAKESVDA